MRLPFCFPLVLFSVFYAVQSVFGLWVTDHELARRFLFVLVVAMASFYGCYRLIERVPLPVPALSIYEALTLAAVVGAVTFYTCLILYAILTAEAVPLFAAFAGADRDTLATLRETLLRTRTGFGQVANYAYVICNNAIMPMVVTYAFYHRKRWRYAVLALFLFGLGLTLQKGSSGSAMLPLMALFILQRRYLATVAAGVALVLLVSSSYVLASGRIGLMTGGAEAQLQGERINVSVVPDKYNIIGRTDQLSLLLNRVLWIPYITAIDWLRYQRDELQGELAMGRTVRPVSALFDIEHLPIEREVARIQWGQNDTGTASSNAAYFVDAYINFGFAGVAIYSCFLAVAIRLLVASRSLPLIAAAIVPVFTSFFVSLPPVLFSGGLVFILLLAVIRLQSSSRGKWNRWGNPTSSELS